jgi:hypothetical protein
MLEMYIENEIKFNIENIINDISNWQNDKDTTEKIENLNNDDISIICNKLLNNTWFMSELNEFVNSNIENEIYHYVKSEER